MAPMNGRWNRWTLEKGILGCCSACHTLLSEEVNIRHGPNGEFLGFPPSPVPPGALTERGGHGGADHLPRAASTPGTRGGGGRKVAPSPPRELLVDCDTPRIWRGNAAGNSSSRGPGALRDPAEKARERARLQALVGEFTREASQGRPCAIVSLGNIHDAAAGGAAKREAFYLLSGEVEWLELRCRGSQDAGKTDAAGTGELLCSWPLHAVLGAHRAEESALVQRAKDELGRILTKDELSRAAVLEFGHGAYASSEPLLLVEDSTEHRDRLVSSVQILRLYRGAVQRSQSANGNTSRPRMPMGATSAGSGYASVDPGLHAPRCPGPVTSDVLSDAIRTARNGGSVRQSSTARMQQRAPQRMRVVADDTPPADDGS